MDTIIVGGGLMGAASAYFLAKRGVSVTLIDRSLVGSGATLASFGNIRRQGRYLPQMPLAHRSLALWGEIVNLLGEDVEFRATGHIRLAFDDTSVADMERFAVEAEPWGLALELLSPPQIAARFPYLSKQAQAASFSPLDGSANPRLIATAFARAAARLGARVVENTDVTQVARTDNGFCVTTTNGEFRAETLQISAGAWGARLSNQFREPVPIQAFGPQMGVTEPLPYRIPPVVGIWGQSKAEGVYFRQVERGNIVFGGGVRMPVDLDPGHAHVDPSNTLKQLPYLIRICPALANVSVIRTWSGCEGYTRDMLPVMGASAKIPGLFYAFGFCGHGFQLGPGVGDVMAELIATGRSDIPLAPFAISRFSGDVGCV